MFLHRHLLHSNRRRIIGGSANDDVTLPDDATVPFSSPPGSPALSFGSPASILTTGTSQTVPDHILIPPENFAPLNRIKRMRRSMEQFEVPRLPLPLQSAKEKVKGEGLRQKLKQLKCS